MAAICMQMLGLHGKCQYQNTHCCVVIGGALGKIWPKLMVTTRFSHKQRTIIHIPVLLFIMRIVHAVHKK